MKKQKKQNFLSILIAILVIALIMMIVSIVYEEKINMNKLQPQNTVQPKDEEKEKQTPNKEEVQDDEEPEEIEPEEEEQEYIGEEEKNTEEYTTLSKDEKVIQLVKKEWGEDNSVTFSIVDKSSSKYRVSVIGESTAVLQWYEVDTETWEVSEF